MNEKIIERFKNKWGDSFDYSKVVYNGYHEKVKIFCRKHNNWFWQTPECHLKFNGCKECSKELKSHLRRKTLSSFIEEAKKVHGDKYDYSKVEYKNAYTKVCITCPEHGEFWQTPHNHLNGNACPECAKKKPNPRIKPFSEVLEGFRNVHGDKYQYDVSTYLTSSKKMRMICPEHGEFWQTPNKHLSGQGCPLCWKDNVGKTLKTPFDEFVKRAKQKHGDKYDYQNTKYNKLSDKIEIICHKKDENDVEHGPFIQNASSHLSGCGCPKCAQEKRTNRQTKTFDEFVEEAEKKHGTGKYIYVKETYKNRNTEMKIICQKHGEFWQKPNKHLRGHGCPKCAKSGIPLTKEEYIDRANEMHDGKYSYKNMDFTTTKDKIRIICPVHGEFLQEAESHLNGHGCPKCSQLVSLPETEIEDFLRQELVGEDVIRGDRKILSGKEIDILIPNRNFGVEYNGLYWHTEKFGKGKYFHIDKTNEANKNGVDLIHIFEDEWAYKKDIVKSKLKHILKTDYGLPRIMGRKCMIKEIKSHDSFDFLEKNHIQGKAYATVHIGAFYDGKLVGVMLFKKDGVKDGYWELNRFSTDINYLCQGIGGKLFSYFIKKYNPIYIKSFADRRWTLNKENNLYTKLGFKFDGALEPDYRYFLNNQAKLERIHKFNFRKQILHKKYDLPLDLTETQMTEKIGAYKIWDCGLYKYIWVKKT